MPTGYTAKLMDLETEAPSFKDFAMSCARAFGACVTMRDDDSNTPIPDKFEPSDWNTKKLAEARSELARLEAMSDKEKMVFGTTERTRALKHSREWLAKDIAANKRLADMQNKVVAWTPPTSEHQELKGFMLQQIEISENKLTYIEDLIAEQSAKAPMGFYADAVKKAEWNIDYHIKENAKEIERSNSRTEWIRSLRASLEDANEQ